MKKFIVSSRGIFEEVETGETYENYLHQMVAKTDFQARYDLTSQALAATCTRVQKMGYDKTGEWCDDSIYTATEVQYDLLLDESAKDKKADQDKFEEEQALEQKKAEYRRRGHEAAGCMHPDWE